MMSDAFEGTYTDLSNKINTTDSTVKLDINYKYNDTDKGKEYIKIVNRNLTIEGNNKIIDANNKAGLFKITNGSEVVLKNMVIRNGLNSSIILVSSKLTTFNVTFENNHDRSEGAAVYCNDATYQGNFDKFIDNDAMNGASIFAYSSKVVLDNALFKSANPVQWGLIYGALTELNITDSIFANTTSKYATAIYNNYLTHVKKSKFYNLHANLTAGAIAVKGSSEFTTTDINDCEFINVSSTKNGGALFLDIFGSTDGQTNGFVKINNTVFDNCSSEFGGAMLQLGGSAEITDSQFIKNEAKENGGAIYTSNVLLEVANVNFTANKANQTGGAIFFDWMSLFVDNSTFRDNAASEGGAIYLYDSSYSISNSTFKNNGEDLRSYFDYPSSSIKDCGDYKSSLNLTKSEFMVRYYGNEIVVNPKIITDASANDPYFDLREYNLTTPVKNQGSMGACWAFGAAGAFESAFLKATGITLDISENNIQNMGIRYSIYGNIESSESGTYYTSTAYFISWLGAINAVDDVYDEFGKISPLSFSPDAYHIVDAVFVNISDRNAIKDALIKYGALNLFVFGANSMDGSYNDTYKSVYNSNKSGNHYVTLVGWNDTFSKSQFTNTPSGDGAWICKNSWGTDWGDEGYFYLSYYDYALQDSDVVGFIIENTDYEKLYQIEVAGLDGFNDDYTVYEDAFVSHDGDFIAAVGSYFEKANSPYTISVYIDENLVYTQSGLVDHAGYNAIKLNQMIAVENNTVFSVRIKSSSVPILSSTRQQLLKNNSFVMENGKMVYLSDSVAPIKVYAYQNNLITKNIIKCYDGKEVIFTVANAIDNIVIGFNGTNQSVTLVDGNGSVNLGNLKIGTYDVNVYYQGKTFKNYVVVKPSIDVGGLTSVTIGYNTQLKLSAQFLDLNAKPLANATVGVKFDGENVAAITNDNGVVDLTIYRENSIGTHHIDLTNPLNNETARITVYIVSRFAGNANVNMYYFDWHTYKVRIKDDFGNFVGKNEIVVVKIGKKSFNVRTDANGYATLKIPDTITPGKYTVTATYFGQTVKNTLVVKQVLKLSKVKVKRSAKKLVLKATLKQGSKAIKNKKVTFKFKGKKYTAKTNKNGIAKVTVKKSVLKKLKAGKKVTYQVTYLKDTVKRSVKVQR